MSYSRTAPVTGRDITVTGTVLEIQRMSTEDGPGIRTTVFMKGCPMKCPWCHNPESISSKPQLHWIEARCIGCRLCLDACPVGALQLNGTVIEIDRAECTGCGACADACPAGALEIMGSEWEVHTLAKELMKDSEFFRQSGGGVTVSGGESTLQWEFVSSLLRVLKDNDIHVCIDSCGICRPEALEAVLPYADMVLFDIKEMDPGLHKTFTGTDLKKVLATLEYISGYINTHERPSEVWIRTPLIPGATASVENISAIGTFIAENCGDKVSRWDLLAFNNLCEDKYKRLGLYWRYSDTELLTEEELEELAETAKSSGVDPAIVRWSGHTRLKEE